MELTGRNSDCNKQESMETMKKQKEHGQLQLSAQVLLCEQSGKAWKGEADSCYIQTQRGALETESMD